MKFNTLRQQPNLQCQKHRFYCSSLNHNGRGNNDNFKTRAHILSILRRKKKKIQSQLGVGRTVENPQKCGKKLFYGIVSPQTHFFNAMILARIRELLFVR